MFVMISSCQVGPEFVGLGKLNFEPSNDCAQRTLVELRPREIMAFPRDLP
jgi:hypothetical protein